MTKGWQYLDFLTNEKVLFWDLTNQRRVCWGPSADPDKVKTTDLALVNVIASSDSGRPKITQRAFLDVGPELLYIKAQWPGHQTLHRDHVLKTILSIFIKLLTEAPSHDGKLRKDGKKKYCEVHQVSGDRVSLIEKSETNKNKIYYEGQKSERTLSGCCEVQEGQRPCRKF